MADYYLRCDASNNISWQLATTIDMTGGKKALAMDPSADIPFWAGSSPSTGLGTSSSGIRVLICDSTTDVISWENHNGYPQSYD